jgi:hypothetical protein
MFKKRIGLISTILGLAVALLGAVQMADRQRLVDILTLFFGGFGAGAGLVKAVIDIRAQRKAAQSAAS